MERRLQKMKTVIKAGCLAALIGAGAGLAAAAYRKYKRKTERWWY